jgi:hypothetical protein
MAQAEAPRAWSRPKTAYDEWIGTLGIPIHKGYFQEDLRTVAVEEWEERGVKAAIIQLAGQEGVTEGRVTELAPGQTAPAVRFTLDEAVYVLDGRGLCTVWADESSPKKTFEWQKHSLFMLPRNYKVQFTNTQGNATARLMHYNALPLAMAITPDPNFFFDNPYVDKNLVGDDDFYSEAKVFQNDTMMGQRAQWSGNFFPDMRAWDNLVPFKGRGAGGHVVWINYPKAAISNHMSVFPAKTYKKAHRHGPGVQIVIPGGEGYSIMWAKEGAEKIVIPWHEGSTFVPPNRWFHQHFNVGGGPARYLAFHGPRGTQNQSETIEDRAADQIEYPGEEPWIREKFEAELATRGLKSIMPDIAYKDPNYEWDYEGEG